MQYYTFAEHLSGTVAVLEYARDGDRHVIQSISPNLCSREAKDRRRKHRGKKEGRLKEVEKGTKAQK